MTERKHNAMTECPQCGADLLREEAEAGGAVIGCETVDCPWIPPGLKDAARVVAEAEARGYVREPTLGDYRPFLKSDAEEARLFNPAPEQLPGQTNWEV